ncbi:MAG: DUF2066 domain-containing protein, partial [Rhodospirillales bacterium]
MTVWLACLIGGLAFVLSPSAPTALAAPYDVYEVAVPVDVTAKSAATAKKEALTNGEMLAFSRLLERLTLLDELDRLPQLGQRGIAPFVNNISLADEKTSGVRYLAKLTVRFKRQEVRKILMDLGISFAETRSKPVLVLPVYQAAGALMLFDDPNPWREAWSGLPERDNLVPLNLPKGDLTDIAAVGAEQAVQGDQQRLNAITRRYKAGDTIVALARLSLDLRTSRPRVEMDLTRYGPNGAGRKETRILTAKAGETPQGLLNRGAEILARLIEDQWKLDNLLKFDQTGVVAVTVPISNLPSWLTVRKSLTQVSVVRQVDLVLLSREEVRANIQYIGELEQLILALEQADLRLSKEGDEWILRLNRASQEQSSGQTTKQQTR